jgi:hypothetical protein
MKIQIFLILYLLTMVSVGREENKPAAYPGNDLIFTHEPITTFGNQETESGFISEHDAVSLKHVIASLPTSQRVYGRGITINTAME